MEALTFIGKTSGKAESLYVLHGDESFLKRHALAAVRRRVFENEVDEGAVTTYPGDKAELAQVWDELETAPFFAPRRLVVVENADPFVTRYRDKLEKKVTALPPTGTLVLDVKTWAATTRLAKLVDANLTIDCKSPKAFKLAPWCVEWAAARCQKQITAAAAQLLVELAGTEMGILDQELQKLAVYVGARSRIDESDVDKLVGKSSTENVFKILDAVADNRPAEALRILDCLFDQGESPMLLAGAIGSQLRKLAQAGRLAIQGMSLGAALQQSKIPPFAVAGAEKQIKHFGQRRLVQLYSWLVDLNLGIRGGSPLSERTQLERLLLRLARPREVRA